MGDLKTTRFSLYYLAGYLLAGGIPLLFFPDLALQLLFATGEYGDIMPRLVGIMLIALGIVIVQLIRLEVYVLYPTTLMVRSAIILGMIFLFILSGDPLFITLIIIVGLGFVLTFSSLMKDRKNDDEGDSTSSDSA